MIDWLAHIFLYMKLNDITRDQFHPSVDQQHYTLPVSDVDLDHVFIYIFKVKYKFERKNIKFNCVYIDWDMNFIS